MTPAAARPPVVGLPAAPARHGAGAVGRTAAAAPPARRQCARGVPRRTTDH
ncbi:hypothetical protein OH807_31620 [Kitasatospora sp. NBC_01560]|uniref:hypothetical protein n=1 Tax=Kitasatospora sp. NBC_01560 TaxID=2975965 RepID=UPI003863D45F